MSVYVWKSGARAPSSISAQVAGEVCADLESSGNLTPHALVEVSRPEDAPLHGAFEWNDTVAAEKYRETQAGYIIRTVDVVIEDYGKPTRAFVSLSVEGSRREYNSIEVALSSKDKREQLLEQARQELAAFERKYKQLAELASVFSAISELVAA